MIRLPAADRVGDEPAIAVLVRGMIVGAAALLAQGAVLLAMGQPVALTLVMELTVGYLIRDNPALNIIQLIFPTAVISGWQLGL